MSISEQVFGEKGYSSSLKMSKIELEEFRGLVTSQWLDAIASNVPEMLAEAKKLGIENYHLISEKMDHNSLWPKASRVLSQAAVDQVKNLHFYSQLKSEFGDFSISDVYDTKQHHGREEIYWRLVRPDVASDVGPLHADTWFHQSFNMGQGMFPKGTVTVKVWIPLYCESGKNGLCIVEGSHKKTWKFRIENINGSPKPVAVDDLLNLGAKLIDTDAGNMLIFHENILHGGVVNQGTKTRVSAEITMVISENYHHSP